MLDSAAHEHEDRIWVELEIFDFIGNRVEEVHGSENLLVLGVNKHHHHGVLVGDCIAYDVTVIVCEFNVHHHRAIVQHYRVNASARTDVPDQQLGSQFDGARTE